jgi:hypothetical protein
MVLGTARERTRFDMEVQLAGTGIFTLLHFLRKSIAVLFNIRGCFCYQLPCLPAFSSPSELQGGRSVPLTLLSPSI